MHSSAKLIISLILIATALLVSGSAEALNLPVLDLNGSYTYNHQDKYHGDMIDVLELTFPLLEVTQSVISPTEYYQADHEDERIIDALVNIDILIRDADPWTFSSGNLSITEGENTYLTAYLTNITFAQVTQWTAVLNADYSMDDLTNLDTSANANSSRFIEILNYQIGHYSRDYTNLRLTLDMLDGPSDGFNLGFSDDSFGNVQGKIEGIPEPASVILLGLGLASLAGFLRRKKS